MKGQAISLVTLAFEARTAVGSIIQNIGDRGLCEEFFRFTLNFFNSKTVKYCEISLEKSRQSITRKKLHKIKRTKMLKIYAARSTVPLYKRAYNTSSLTGTYLDTVIEEFDPDFEEEAAC